MFVSTSQYLQKSTPCNTKIIVASIRNRVSKIENVLISFFIPLYAATHLVEIYHNIAAKNSDSDEGQINKPKKTIPRSEEIQVEISDVPPLKLPLKVDQFCETQPNFIQSDRCHKITQNEGCYDPPEAPRTISSYIKNYELPTIASRMKQAAKYYMNTFNFKVSTL